tara:strand:+ start:667 stop:1038 length:372 start_codon:yes stop_codon:yes gene_type:complete
MLFGSIFSGITNLAGTWLKGKQEKAQLKTKIELTKLKSIEKKIEQDGNWEELQANASADSWKDELWTVCFVIIIFACFVPALQPYIENGFKFLREDCPEWLSWGILASIGASFGLKSISKFKG